MKDRSAVTEKLDQYLSRPRTLKALCEEAGKSGAYRRVQQALRRWRQGTGKGVPERDAEWIENLLSELSG